jgi:DNA-binding MarR family transcriptional regulator
MDGAPSQLDAAQCAEIARTCACFNFRKVSRSVTQLFDQMLAATGLRSTQLVILLCAHLQGPISMAALARELVMDPSTLTRNLRPLMNQQLITVATGPGRGGKSVEITTAGQRALVAAVPYWKKAQDQLVGKIGGDRWSTMISDLDAIVDASRTREA